MKIDGCKITAFKKRNRRHSLWHFEAQTDEKLHYRRPLLVLAGVNRTRHRRHEASTAATG